MPDPMSDLRAQALAALDRAMQIIETGDDRLLASDGPAGGQPPDISLREWRELYVSLTKARSALTALGAAFLKKADGAADSTAGKERPEDAGSTPARPFPIPCDDHDVCERGPCKHPYGT